MALVLPGLLAQTADTDRLSDIKNRWRAKELAARNAARAETDVTRRQSILGRHLPRLDEFGPEFLRISEEQPGSAASFEALEFCVRTSEDGPWPPALQLLRKYHRDDARCIKLCELMGRWDRDSCNETLVHWADHSAHPELRGHALLALVKNDLRQWDRAQRAEWDPREVRHKLEETELKQLDTRIAKRLKTLRDQYGTVTTWNGTMKDYTTRAIYVHQTITPGRPAPVTHGVDLHGKELRLDQFSGKVVLLQFWGHW